MNFLKKSMFLFLIATMLFFNVLKINAETFDYTVHTVKSNETLWLISNQYNVHLNLMYRHNSLIGNTIYPGQSLKITTNDYFEYNIAAGDTLYKVALKHDNTIQNIVEFNNINVDDQLYIGNKLYIPILKTLNDTSSYVVKTGDTPWLISQKLSISLNDLLIENNFEVTTTIYPEQVLKIPNSQSINTTSIDPISNDTNSINTTNTDTSAQDKSIPYVTYSTYTVQSGDNFWSLGIKYGIPYQEILEANQLSETSTLYIGQILSIPVHHVPVIQTNGEQYGEYLDWWTQAQYVFPMDSIATITDFETNENYEVIRSFGAFHADCEPLTENDAKIMHDIQNKYSWDERACIVTINGRKIAASYSNMPHDIQNIDKNNYNGHFDIHFKNSLRHKDSTINNNHQEEIKKAAGIK